jgi:hypothetical protein
MAVICLVQMVKNNNQAGMPVPKEYIFLGEYSYDGENWYPYNEVSEVSALEGDMVVRGHLDSDILEGGMLNFYCNHIGVSVYVNGELLFIDTPSEIKNYGIDLMASMCGKRWEQLLCPKITTEDEIEIRFINYHNYGNKNAYKEAMSSLLVTPTDNTILEVYLKSYIKPFQMVGYALLVIAVMILGAALAAVVFKSNITKNLFKIGMATLFAGGYMMFDIMMIYFTDELLVVKTYGRQLCLMLATYFIGWMVCDALKGRLKKIAEIIMSCSVIINLFIISFVIAGKVLLYDTTILWELAQCIISIVLIVLSALELIRDKKCNIELICYAVVNAAIIVDVVGIGDSMYYYGVCFKTAYIIRYTISRKG